MKQLKDNQLVWRVKVKKCDKSLLELISRHTPLFYKISQKYFPFAFKGGSSQTVDDIIGNFVRYKCLNYLNKNSKLVDAEEGKLNFFFQKKSLEEYSKATEVDDHIFVNNLIDQFKDDRMKKVFELRYFSGEKKMTWVNIGTELNVSAQTAINLHNRGKSIIKKKFKSSSRFADKIL